MRNVFALVFLLVSPGLMYAQPDSAAVEEEDFSMYENLDFADAGAKRFCTPKVFDLSPAKLISIHNPDLPADLFMGIRAVPATMG